MFLVLKRVKEEDNEFALHIILLKEQDSKQTENEPDIWHF